VIITSLTLKSNAHFLINNKLNALNCEERSIKCSRNNPLPDGNEIYRRRNEKEKWSDRSFLSQRVIIVRRYWILDLRRRRRESRRREVLQGTPHKEYVVVLSCSQETKCEKHKADVSADVNFLQVNQSGDQLARSRHVFYLFPVWRQLHREMPPGVQVLRPDGNHVPISLIAR